MNVSKSRDQRSRVWIWQWFVFLQSGSSVSNFLSLHTTVSIGYRLGWIYTREFSYYFTRKTPEYRSNPTCILYSHFWKGLKRFLEKDKSCWINWDKSQLKPQRVFDERSKNYKELDDGCWKVTQNESNFFDSLNSWFQNHQQMSFI